MSRNHRGRISWNPITRSLPGTGERRPARDVRASDSCDAWPEETDHHAVGHAPGKPGLTGLSSESGPAMGQEFSNAAR